jgi:acetyl-CoA carboxylase carboxyl transferase subunit beta
MVPNLIDRLKQRLEHGSPGGSSNTHWVRCASEGCGAVLYRRAFRDNQQVCTRCEHHSRLSASDRIVQLVDDESFNELDDDLISDDPLEFVAQGQPYRDKLREAQRKTGLNDAAVSGSATINGFPIELVVLEFAFMGASMGSVVGEKVARAAERAAWRRVPLVTVNASGGARMHEGVISLMQMAKTAASLAKLSQVGVPHISILTDPTLGGVTASYAGLGDVIIAEQGALVGFAGPRVIEQVARQKLPADAQRASFLLEHGMVDMVVPRRQLRATVTKLLKRYAARKPARGVEAARTSTTAAAAKVASQRSAWERVWVARDAQRPTTLDYLELAFSDFIELHGDRLRSDDHAIVGGLAALDGRTVMVIGHQKGRNTRENAYRRFGMARPEGYRKALRLMRQAEKLGLPVVTLIDIPGADPSLAAEEGGQAFAIAENLLAMSQLRVPLVCAILGEGGSGGALALGIADRVLMLEHAVYSVASPEAAASILWRDGKQAPAAAEALKITAEHMAEFGIIDSIVPEPAGGAQADPVAMAANLRHALGKHLAEVVDVDPMDLVATRMERYRQIGTPQ